MTNEKKFTVFEDVVLELVDGHVAAFAGGYEASPGEFSG